MGPISCFIVLSWKSLLEKNKHYSFLGSMVNTILELKRNMSAINTVVLNDRVVFTVGHFHPGLIFESKTVYNPNRASGYAPL